MFRETRPVALMLPRAILDQQFTTEVGSPPATLNRPPNTVAIVVSFMDRPLFEVGPIKVLADEP
jgi:hypothetical protein